MNPTQPPRIAAWLLKRFASGPKRESLIGDLLERYRNGRSRAWFWRQVLSATMTAVVTDIRDHKLLDARALVIGWGLLWCCARFVTPLENPIASAVSVHTGNWLLTNGHDSLRWWWFRSQLCDLPTFAMWWITCAFIGWIVGHTHRSSQSSMVMLFTTSWFMANVPRLVAALQFAMVVGPARRGFILAAVANTLGGVASICAGGLWSALSADDSGTHTAPFAS
jgi:hypothetical protein